MTPPTPLWRQRNFMLLWGGQLASWLGTEVSGIALPLVVLALTGSPAQAGAMAAVRGLVYVAWAIPAGVAIDRWDRRRVMAVANAGSGLALGSIALALALGRLSLAHLVIANAVEGSCFVFANLGRFAALTRVVSREQFPAAAAQTGTAEHLALLAGPPLGGFLYQAAGGALAFAADALSYAVNAVAILGITVPLRAEATGERQPVGREIAAGIAWLWGQPILRFLNVVTAGRTVVAAGLALLIVVVARERHASSLAIGAIFAGGAVGGLVGSLVAARLHRRFRARHLLIGTSVASAAVLGLYGAATTLPLLAAVTALYYAVDPLYTVTTATYAAATIPDALRGRVSSLTRLLVLGAHSGGFFLTGLLLQYGGSGRAIAVFAGLLAALALLVAGNRRLARL